MEKKIKKLRNEIEKKLNNWNERSQFTISGVKNLSMGDIDTILMHLDHLERNVTGNFLYHGGVKEVLEKNGLLQ